MDTTPDSRAPDSAADPARARAAAILRALKTHRKKLARKLEAVRGDLAEARRAGEFRRAGETLLTFLKQVPARAARVALPDPADHDRSLEIALDPMVKPQVNAARYFKRAAKAERGMEEIPPRLEALEALIESLASLIARSEAALAPAAAATPLDEALVREMEQAFDRMPPNARKEAGVPPLRGGSDAGRSAAGGAAARADVAQAKGGMKRDHDLPSKLQPRRLKTREGWDVLIGRNNEGNDHLTLHLARPEDYWFHVHGTPGSHVVLRRGKGKDEPSKQTLLEVAAWTAFYSKSATAGTVPVIYTLKKYVRKPRKAPAGTVTCEREKTLMVKPKEPGREALADEGG
jgi:predicted ribosome quality control (RQC) complex YloA/Tae2 family protein